MELDFIYKMVAAMTDVPEGVNVDINISVIPANEIPEGFDKKVLQMGERQIVTYEYHTPVGDVTIFSDESSNIIPHKDDTR